MSPKVSVIIPSFNHEAFVREAIDSVLASSMDDLEVIVIDDGSTDSSPKILEEYRHDPRVRLFFHENRGAHAAINSGLELAQGEIACILDSDDVFPIERIAVLAERLRATPGASLATSWIQVIDAAGAELGVKKAWLTLPPWPTPSRGPRLSDLDCPRLAMLETNWISTTSNLVFPMRMVRDNDLRFAPLRYAHDWDFILSACPLGTVVLVEEPLLRYRVHGANTIGNGDGADRGRMRFEIMWVVARHALRVLRSVAASEEELIDLRRRLSRSAPAFGHEPIFDQLLVLRGVREVSPPAYDALLDPDHRFTRAAVKALQKSR